MTIKELKQVVLDADMRRRGLNLVEEHDIHLAVEQCAMFVARSRSIVEVVVRGADNEFLGARRWRRREIPFDLGAIASVLTELGVTLRVPPRQARTLEEKLAKIVAREEKAA